MGWMSQLVRGAPTTRTWVWLGDLHQDTRHGTGQEEITTGKRPPEACKDMFRDVQDLLEDVL